MKSVRSRPTFPFTLILIAALCLIGCGTNSVIAPDLQSGSSTNQFSSRSLWGQWMVSVDGSRVDIVPIRSTESHWDVTKFVKAPACPGCVTFANAHVVSPGVLSVTVKLAHPFNNPSLDAFDVRGIIYGTPVMLFPSGSVSGVLANPDGYCARWSHDPWANINPYIAFAVDDPERRFKAGSSNERECLINLPGKGKLEFAFAVDACWLSPKLVNPDDPSLSPHCNEAVDLKTEISGPVNANDGAFALATISFRDWQSDGNKAKVTLEAPQILPSVIQATYQSGDSTPKFICKLSNQLGAQPGLYRILVCERDQLNDPIETLADFNIAEVEITSDTPMVQALLISPPAASLPDNASVAQFEAVAKFTDGGLASVSDAKWSSSGADLNGNKLIDIDSTGLAERVSSRWWGGTAKVEASWQGFVAKADVYCVDPFADSAAVEYGALVDPEGAYYDPKNLLGPPRGGGQTAGGMDICTLGYGGVATLEFTNNIIVDGPGPDFIVFENAFYAGGCDWNSVWQDMAWSETAIVEVSQNGTDWYRFPPDYNPDNVTCDIPSWANASSFANLAGVHPVYANVADDGSLVDGINPTDPASAGGDSFDLASLGLKWCRFVRLIDTGDSVDAPGSETYDKDGDLIDDYGKESPLGAQFGLAGFDCDSVAAIHWLDPLSK